MATGKSPRYPNFSLRQAVQRAEKVFKEDRRNPIDREVAAKHMGYTRTSGASDKAIGTMTQYGLFERVGKGEIKVSQLAVDILHPDNDVQYKQAIARAAFSPPLFKALKTKFPDGVSVEALRSYLVRENFLDRAISPIISAFTDTCAFLKQENAFESDSARESGGAESMLPDELESEEPPVTYGGACVGDLVQWESGGALQFERPRRVRLVTPDGQYVAVDGSETGIPMDQVIVQERAPPDRPQPPMFPLGLGELPPAEKPPEVGESEWMRNRLGGGTAVRLMVTGDMGPKQITKLIKLLQAQRAVLQDDDDDEEAEDAAAQPG